MKIRLNKKKVLLSCVILTIIGIFLLSIGLIIPGYLAFSTNKYIPVYTEAVEKIESLVWNRFNDDVSALVVDEVVKKIDTLEEDEEGKIDMYKLFEEFDNDGEMPELKDQALPSEVNFEFIFAGEVYLPDWETSAEEKYSYDITVSGASDIDKETRDTEGTVSFKGNAYMFSMDEKLSYKNDTENGVTFVKISDGTVLRDMGGWFYFDWNEMLEEAEVEVESEIDDSTPEWKLDKEQVEEIKNFMRSDFWLPNVTMENGKSFDKKRARCVTRSWDRDKIKAMIEFLDKEMPKMNEAYEDEITGIILFLEGLNEVTIYSCVDRENGNLYEIDIHIDYELALNSEGIWNSVLDEDYSTISASTSMMPMIIDLNMQLSGYGESKTIIFPEDAVKVEDYMKEFNLFDY